MSISQLNTVLAGQPGVHPRIYSLVTSDSYATITTAGYLNNFLTQGYSFDPLDVILINYANGASVNFFTIAVSNGIVTLSPLTSNGEVILPVVSGDFAIFSGTLGTIADGGFSPSDPAKTKVAMVNGATTANHVAQFSDTAGTIQDGGVLGTAAAKAASDNTKATVASVNGATIVNHIATYVDTAGTVGEDATTAINGGNIQAGLSGTAGFFASFPTTAAKGSLELKAVENTGDTITTISNAAMGQASVISIPDPAAATANFVVAPSALVSGNLVKASGTAGLVVDAGARIIANTTSAFAGGGTTNTFTATGLSSSAVGSAVIRTSTNSVSITKALPGTNTLAITFSADPGAGTTVDYIYVTAAQS